MGMFESDYESYDSVEYLSTDTSDCDAELLGAESSEELCSEGNENWLDGKSKEELLEMREQIVNAKENGYEYVDDENNDDDDQKVLKLTRHR